MKSNYKGLGDGIRQVDVRNKDLHVDNLLELSVSKVFMPSIDNTIGTDMFKPKSILGLMVMLRLPLKQMMTAPISS